MQVSEEDFETVQKTPIATVSESAQHTLTIYRVERPDRPHFATELQFQGNYFIWECNAIEQAQLAAGVLNEANHGISPSVSEYGYPAEMQCPMSIATAGRQVLAGYMKMFYDESEHIQRNGGTRYCVAQALDVEPDTVSSYWNRVRWTGCIECGNEATEKKTVHVTGDEVVFRECLECGHYFVIPEDLEKQTINTTDSTEYPQAHSEETELVPVIVEHDGHEYRFWKEDRVGFFTAEPDRHVIVTVPKK